MDQTDYTGDFAPKKSAFERFKAKIVGLSERQNQVFLELMEKIDQRKVEESRLKLEESSGNREPENQR